MDKAEYSKLANSQLKRFTDGLLCRGKDSPCFAKYECNNEDKLCHVVSKNTSGAYESYSECSSKCGLIYISKPTPWLANPKLNDLSQVKTESTNLMAIKE